jgi:hypothetical protein
LRQRAAAPETSSGAAAVRAHPSRRAAVSFSVSACDRSFRVRDESVSPLPYRGKEGCVGIVLPVEVSRRGRSRGLVLPLDHTAPPVVAAGWTAEDDPDADDGNPFVAIRPATRDARLRLTAFDPQIAGMKATLRLRAT